MSSVTPPRQPAALFLTNDDDACALIAARPEAFLIGFILDQQIMVQKAFQSPRDLEQRVGTIEPAKLAVMPLDKLEAAFAEKPALHRYPKAMATRVRDAMQHVVEHYGGDVGELLFTAADRAEITKRLLALPGFGKQKTFTVVAVLTRQFGCPYTGWEDAAPSWGNLGDVNSHEDLAAYQLAKNTFKKARRAEAAAAAAGAAR